MSAGRRREGSSRGGADPRAGNTVSRRRTRIVQAVVLVVVAALTYVLLLRPRGPGSIPGDAVAAAEAAGCGALEQPVQANPDRTHLDAGETFAYPDPPAAAGPHDPSPLPPEPHVYAEPVPETRAVHNLEHAYVLIYDEGLSADTVDALEAYARGQRRVIMAPYPDLPDGTGLALLAWNTRWLCPPSITPDEAVRVASGFVDAFRGTTVAPEAPRGLLGPLLQP